MFQFYKFKKMNDKIFELQQELITLQDSLKDAILNELDVEKHDGIIKDFSKKEADLATEIEKEIEKEVKRIEKEAQDRFNDNVEQQEDSENINDNHPLVNTFKKLVKEGATADVIAKQFKEDELIEIGKEYGFEFTTKGTKIEKVNLLIEAINK